MPKPPNPLTQRRSKKAAKAAGHTDTAEQATRQPQHARWRWSRLASGPRPHAATVVLVALAVALTWAVVRSDNAPIEQTTDTLRLSYRVEPSGAAAAEQTAQVMRARLAAAGIADARVSVSSSASLTITAPAAVRADITALVQ